MDAAARFLAQVVGLERIGARLYGLSATLLPLLYLVKLVRKCAHLPRWHSPFLHSLIHLCLMRSLLGETRELPLGLLQSPLRLLEFAPLLEPEVSQLLVVWILMAAQLFQLRLDLF